MFQALVQHAVGNEVAQLVRVPAPAQGFCGVKARMVVSFMVSVFSKMSFIGVFLLIFRSFLLCSAAGL